MARPLAHWLLLLLLVAVWGSSFPATKIAVTEVAPATVVAARLVIGALALVALGVVCGRPLPRGRSLWSAAAVMAVVGNVVPFFLITWGQQRIDAGIAGILMAVMPLFTLVLAHYLVAGERLTAVRILGFVLGFTGMVVLFSPTDAAVGTGVLLSQLAVLAGAACYAANAILARHRPASDAGTAATAVLLAGSALMIPVAVAVDGVPPGLPSAEAVSAIGFLGLVATGFATVLYFRIITLAGPTFLSLINYLIPLWAVASGIVVLGERPAPKALLALGLVLAGIAVSERRPRRPTEPDPDGAGRR